MSSIRIPRLWNPSSHISHLRISHYLLNAMVQTDRHLFVGRRGLEKFEQNAYALIWRKQIIVFSWNQLWKKFAKSTFWKQVGRVAFFKGAHHKGPFLYLFKKMSKDMDTFSRSFDISIWRMHYNFLQKSSSFFVPGIVVVPLMIKCSFACRQAIQIRDNFAIFSHFQSK